MFLCSFVYILHMLGYHRLSYDERPRVVFMLEHGDSYSKIAKELFTNPGAISKLIAKQKQIESIADKGRSGRPRKTTSREDRILVCTSLENCRLSASDIKEKLVDKKKRS